MNESLFFLHIFVVTGFSLLALRLGKHALISFIVIQGILANLFVVKQMPLFGLAVTCSDVFAIGGILSLNLLQEYFGRESCRNAIQISLLGLIFFVLMSQIHLAYQPTLLDGMQGAFQTIFSTTPRITIASIATFYLVQQIDVRLFPFLKGNFPTRVFFSLLFSQAIDTVLFSFLGLYGLVESLLDIIIVSFLIKSIIIAASSPFVGFAKKWVRNELSL